MKVSLDTKIAKIKAAQHSGRFEMGDLEVEILSLDSIPGGVQLFARAWRNDSPVGFGDDGSVEIERFRIFNPPILVDDPNGKIVREWTGEDGIPKKRTLREDPIQATREALSDIIRLVGKPGDRVVAGKRGNTTSTFYPAAGANTPVDGRVGRELGGGAGEAFSTLRTSAGNTAAVSEGTDNSWLQLLSDSVSDQWRRIRRCIFGFDTSPIGTDTVTSAIFSLYSTGAGADNYSQSTVLDRSVPASSNDLVNSDYDIARWDGVEQAAARITVATFIASSGYKDYTLNVTGRGNVNGSGLSWFGLRISADFDNSAPTWANTTAAQCGWSFADEAGTTQDPKLVVEHSVAANTNFFAFMGPQPQV